MTESDYTLAANLARVRIAIEVVGTLQVDGVRDKAKRATVMLMLRELEEKWQGWLEKPKGRGRP